MRVTFDRGVAIDFSTIHSSREGLGRKDSGQTISICYGFDSCRDQLARGFVYFSISVFL